MQEALTKFYESIAPQLLNVMPTGREISSPLFLSVLHGYAIAKRRLLIVGQETYTWFGSIDELKQHPNPARKMQERYEAFNLGEGCLRYPFWSIAHQIQKKLEAYVPAFGFMWSNLFACDEKKRTPSNEVGDLLRSFRILPNEIRILEPDAIIFLTGPRYDYTVNAFFPDCSCKEVVIDIPKRELAQLSHKDLPPLTFRTYHPNSLRRQKKMYYVDLITKLIRDAWGS